MTSMHDDNDDEFDPNDQGMSYWIPTLLLVGGLVGVVGMIVDVMSR